MSRLTGALTKKYTKKEFYPFLNVIKSLEERKNLTEKINTKPFFLYLDPTSYCNLECPFCPTGLRKSDRPSTDMSLSIFKHIIDEIGFDLFHMSFYNWGEPLLNKDFVEMVKYLQQYYITSDVSTNLSFPLGRDKAKELINSGLDRITISVDGASQETYEKYRIGGDLELIFKNMRLLAEEEKSSKNNVEVQWRFLVFKHNQHEIPKAIKIADELGVKIFFQAPHVDPTKFDEWSSTIDQFSATSWPYNDGKKELMSDKQKSTEVVPTRMMKSKLNFKSGCDWLWFTSVINANGSVAPCCITVNQKDDFGILNEGSLSNIRNNEKYTKSRGLIAGNLNNSNIGTICEQCPAKGIWHFHDWILIIILQALLEKLPFKYFDYKKTDIKEFDWDFIEKLKVIINDEVTKT